MPKFLHDKPTQKAITIPQHSIVFQNSRANKNRTQSEHYSMQPGGLIFDLKNGQLYGEGYSNDGIEFLLLFFFLLFFFVCLFFFLFLVWLFSKKNGGSVIALSLSASSALRKNFDIFSYLSLLKIFT